jgi:hypothetical protein
MIALIPFSLLLNNGTQQRRRGRQLDLGPVFCYLSILIAGARVVFAIAFFSSMAIAMNRTVPASHHRASMNGLSML